MLAIIVFIYNYPSPCICTCANHTTHITCVSLVALFVPSVRLACDQCLALKDSCNDLIIQLSDRQIVPSTLISAKSHVAPTIAAAVEHIVMVDVALSLDVSQVLFFFSRVAYEIRKTELEQNR